MECKDCKYRKIDMIDGKEVEYCYPPFSSHLFSVPCENIRKTHPKQCLWINNKISYAEMVGDEDAFCNQDFKF